MLDFLKEKKKKGQLSSNMNREGSSKNQGREKELGPRWRYERRRRQMTGAAYIKPQKEQKKGETFVLRRTSAYYWNGKKEKTKRGGHFQKNLSSTQIGGAQEGDSSFLMKRGRKSSAPYLGRDSALVREKSSAPEREKEGKIPRRGWCLRVRRPGN